MPRAVKKKTTRAATLADVGRVAGVSAMAASAVLNDAKTSSRISEATRERILRAAAELRYRPNAAARALAARRMNTIGVASVIEGGAGGELNQYFLEIFNGILEAASERNQNTAVLTLHNWDDDLQRLTGFCDGRVDGVILIGPRVQPLKAEALPEHTPFVSLHSNIALPNVVNLESDEESGAYQVVSHLLAAGHRRILHLSGESRLLGAQRRIQGYRRALTQAGIAFDPDLVWEAGYNQIPARAALLRWLAKHEGQPLPDAIFGANDSCAIGAIEALAELGIDVPDTISVAGFDDTIAARTTVPQLCTARQPLRAMGRKAAELLLDRIEHQHDLEPPTVPANVVFPTELIARASVGRPASSTRAIPRIPAPR